MKLCLVRFVVIVASLVVGADAALAYKGIHSSGHGPEKLNYDSLYRAAAPLNESPVGRQLVQECLAAYGGQAHLEKLQTLILHYRMVHSLSGDTADLWKYFAPGPKLKKTRHLSGHSKELILNDVHAWRVMADKAVELGEISYFGQLYSYEVLRMPLPLAESAPENLRYGTRESDSLGYIYWKARDSLLVVIGISPVTGLVMLCEGIITTDGGTAVYANRFAHHREVEAYVFPGLIVDVSLGLELGASHLESVEINPPLSDKLFHPDPTTQRAH